VEGRCLGCELRVPADLFPFDSPEVSIWWTVFWVMSEDGLPLTPILSFLELCAFPLPERLQKLGSLAHGSWLTHACRAGMPTGLVAKPFWLFSMHGDLCQAERGLFPILKELLAHLK
jgi:hypothetical protein